MPDALAGMRALGIGGLNVTMPHKEAVHDAMDVLDPVAAALRTVNTVVPLADGRLAGHTTDGAGFLDALRIDEGVDVAGMRVVVLGAGGAARAVVDALARAGAAQVIVVNRSPDNAASAAALAGSVGRTGAMTDVAAADLVVNATPIGMGTEATPVDPASLRAGQIVVDLVYHPLDTALLRAARAAGARRGGRSRDAGPPGRALVPAVDRCRCAGDRDARGGIGRARRPNGLGPVRA